ncbi:MAG: 30S ribosomal protein S9 [Nanoarchaeota archaeon]
MAQENFKKPLIVQSGKRKTAVARAVLYPKGNGKISINNRKYENLETLDRLRILEPLKIAEHVLNKIDFDVKINVRGGGKKGQIDAARLALAKAILKYSGNPNLEKAFTDYDRNLLVADVRRKEAYKPDDSKARKKRQTSYR